ncbi:hypothetical protein M5E89_10515 [Acidaminococcus intestini]|nr:hypothetical protein M5E89_10515 [Acidaminococcus intestini]
MFLQSWPVLFRKIGFLALVEGAVFLFSLLGSYYGESSAPVWKMTCV